jgi:Rap1a immunity proteins
MGQMKAMLFLAPAIDGPLRACPPNGSNIFQAAKVVVAYLDAHPERLHESFLGLAITAIAQAWPCAPGKKR